MWGMSGAWDHRRTVASPTPQTTSTGGRSRVLQESMLSRLQKRTQKHNPNEPGARRRRAWFNLPPKCLNADGDKHVSNLSCHAGTCLEANDAEPFVLFRVRVILQVLTSREHMDHLTSRIQRMRLRQELTQSRVHPRPCPDSRDCTSSTCPSGQCPRGTRSCTNNRSLIQKDSIEVATRSSPRM